MNILSTQQKSMMMALVASRPGLRSVEISDIMDLSLQMVMVALQELVQSCTLIAHGVVAPNGLDAKAYTIPGVACPRAHSAPGAAVPDAPVAPAKPAMTNVAKAVEFIAGNGGTATSGELHRLLGLKPTEYASSYLKDGVKDGRLIKEGGNWTVGAPLVAAVPIQSSIPVKTPVPVVPEPVAAMIDPDPVSSFSYKADSFWLPVPVAPAAQAHVVPTDPMPAVDPVRIFDPEPSPIPMPPAITPDPAPASPLACPVVVIDAPIIDLGPVAHDVDPVRDRPCKLSYALWSDGTMHFAKDGVTVLAIAKADVKKMFAYLDNFAITEESANV